jgi:hypothetical protein
MMPVRYAEGYESVLKRRGGSAALLRYALAGDDLVSRLRVYNADLQNFLAGGLVGKSNLHPGLSPSGWKIDRKKSGGRRRRN